MCTIGCAEFIGRELDQCDVAGKRVLEVGSLDPKGVVRSLAMPLSPARYLGVDMVPGPGVDVVCRAEDLIHRFGPSSFDIVISTEMLEHVTDWKQVIHNLKGVLDSRGLLLLTTRSRGFEFHTHPLDFWRFETEDMIEILADLDVEVVETDREFPGVFVRARRQTRFHEKDLSAYEVYSVVRRRRANTATPLDVAGAHLLAVGKAATEHLLPLVARTAVRRLINRLAGSVRKQPLKRSRAQ